MPALLPVDEVLERLLGGVTCLVKTERVALIDASGRVLAEPVAARISVPPTDNSAMDGYAARAADLQVNGCYRVSGRIAAGETGKPLQAGTLARIFTGASLPDGADVVIIQEDTSQIGDEVRIDELPLVGANIRRAGQDILAGAEVLAAGRVLRPADLGLLASVGLAEVSVYQRLKVAIMSTGDELVDPPASLGPGQIYNSNHYTVKALLTGYGFEVVDLGLVRDDPAATVAALRRGADRADVVLSTGGVSVGEEDHVKAAVMSLGTLDIWRLAIKPGKPLAFGEVLGTPFFGLPGNPVSTFVTLMVIARPYLLRCQGARHTDLPVVSGRADFDCQPGSRREYFRVQLAQREGETWLCAYENQGSAVMSSVSWADALAEIDIGVAIKRGDSVKAYLLPWH